MPNVLRVVSRLGKAGAVALTSVATGLLALALLIALQGPSASAAAVRLSPPSTVSGTLISRPAGALKPGTVVGSSAVGLRIFPSAKDGFALASVADGQYPVTSVDGGISWRIDGPPLHVNAAQAPLVVGQIGATGQKTFFAWGGPGSGGQSVDVTSDGGAHWYRAILGAEVEAVVSRSKGELLAFTQGQTDPASIWIYLSKDGGREWHYSSAGGAM